MPFRCTGGSAGGWDAAAHRLLETVDIVRLVAACGSVATALRLVLG